MKLFITVMVSSCLTLAFAWVILPMSSPATRLKLFELYTCSLNYLDPCPDDKVLKEKFQYKRKSLEQLRDLTKGLPWSKLSEDTGKDIIQVESKQVLSYEPWEILDEIETNSVLLDSEKKEQFRTLMKECGVGAIIKETDGVIKFQYWSRSIPYMNLKKYIVHNESPYEVEDCKTSFQTFSNSSDSPLSPIQKLYYPKYYYTYTSLSDGWGIEYGIM